MSKLLAFVMACVIIPFAAFLTLIPTPTESDCATSGSSAPGRAPPNATLFEAIKVNTPGDPRLMLTMLMGTHIESGWDNRAVGDGSFGPYQIQDPGVIHPNVTVAQAMNPAFSTNYMLPEYKQSMRKVGALLWNSDPVAAAENVIFGAERPAERYRVYRGLPTVQRAFNESVEVMKSMGISTDFKNTGLSLPDPVSPQTGASAAPGTAPDPCLSQVNGLVANGVKGKFTIAPDANAGGRQMKPELLQFVAEVAGIYGKQPFVLTTGTNHDYLTVNGTVSGHYNGNGADFGMILNKGTNDGPVGDRIATACLVAAGMPAAEAAQKALQGGLFDLQKNGLAIQCIWKTDEGGNHHHHVHIGVKKVSASLSALPASSPSRIGVRRYVLPAALHPSPSRITFGKQAFAAAA